MYKIIYDPQGLPMIFRVSDNASIPANIGNSDFRSFLSWNELRNPPLDWQTAIIVDPGPIVPTINERVALLEEVVQEMNL